MGVCSAAVAAVYAAGYMYTQPAVQANAGSPPALSAGGHAPGGNASAGARAGAAKAAAPPAHHAASHRKPAPAGVSSRPSAAASQQTAPPAKSSRPSTPAPAARAKAKYRDGVYTGSGANPYGSLSVSLAVRRGKIAAVKITQYAMHYPQSFIDPQLPQEVVSMQTWRIYIVSGATASTYNFAEAVYNALKKAKA